VLYIYDDGIIDICYVLVWNFVSCIRRIKSVQKQIKEKKKKKIYRGGFQTASIDHFQKWIFFFFFLNYLSIEAVI
jgi:hypothetical protein